MSELAAVLFVNEAFYEAFRARDLETMDQLWGQDQPVACIHPGWRALTTREDVMSSWNDIFSNEAMPEVFCRGAQAFDAGDCAFVICYEVIGTTVLVATNIFRRDERIWRMVHHQAGPCDLTPSALPEEDTEESAIQ